MTEPDLNSIAAWQYDLPEELIAARPAPQRDASRLMVIRRSSGAIEHCHIRDLPALLHSGDRLVFNNTRVLPARLFGFRTETQGRWEGLFLGCSGENQWVITGQTRGRLRGGETLTLVPADSSDQESASEPAELLLELIERRPNGTWLVQPNCSESAYHLLERFGTLPLPPYIGRKVADESDKERYQTVYAREAGAIAAPTAGLHFTPDMLDACVKSGIQCSEVTLHVGIGTFRPVSTSRLSEHEMHSEWCRVSAETAGEISMTRQAGGSIVAVGTTSVRTVEAAARDSSGDLTAWQGETDLFIRPGFEFSVVDQLLTNFHLPGSTLIVMIAALAGYDLTMEAYQKAVENRYRFYSYGDAMLIL